MKYFEPPPGHGSHDTDPAGAVLPREQGSQDDAPEVEEYVPAEHSSQLPVSILAKVPGSHTVQLTEPSLELAPGPHDLHSDAPEVDE